LPDRKEWCLISTDPTGGSPSSASADREEAFRRSLAQFTQQLADRKLFVPTEFPVASADDESSLTRPRRLWYRLALAAILMIAVLAGASAFLAKGGPTSSASKFPATSPLVPPGARPASPTGSDFARQSPEPPASQPDQSQAYAAPLPVKDAAPASPSTPLDSQAIREIQTRLQSLGLDPGPLDGIAGPRTQTAVKRYEQSKGREPTGNTDSTLLGELRESASR
jgi:hypothetical protein